MLNVLLRKAKVKRGRRAGLPVPAAVSRERCDGECGEGQVARVF